jgi:hypothetical protein
LAAASSLSSFLDLPDASGKAVSQSAQRNIVVVHVDDLGVKHPQLVSVWSVFFVANEQTYITMAPLYPGTVPDPAASLLASSFDLNGRKKPAKEFLKALQAYQVVWDGYILVDDQGMMGLQQWLGGNHGSISLTGQSSNTAAMVLQEERLLLAGVCYGLNQAGPIPDESVQWRAISDHFKTDLPMRRVLPHWRQMNQARSTLVCNVFSD